MLWVTLPVVWPVVPANAISFNRVKSGSAISGPELYPPVHLTIAISTLISRPRQDSNRTTGGCPVRLGWYTERIDSLSHH